MPLFAASEWDWLKVAVLIILFVLSLFMWIIILIQRGRGGGLIGALGGAGGSSPFGSRAGDKFTRVTLILAVIWIVLNAGLTWALQKEAAGKPAGDRVSTPAPGPVNEGE